MAETHLDFHYTRAVVVSAQRTRFLRSSQLKVILLIWLGSTLFLAAPLLLPRVFPPGPYTSWGLVVQIALAYIVTLLVLILITPVADFYINRFWRLPLTLRFSEKHLRVTVTGKTGGLRLQWNQIRQVDEDGRSFILHYGTGSKFIILPKAAFEPPAEENRFRDLLARRALIPADDSKEDEEEGAAKPQAKS